MSRSTSANLKNKRSRKVIEDSDRESSVCQSDSEGSDYEGYEYYSPSESEAEETSQKEKAKKEKPKAATAGVTRSKPVAVSKVAEKKKDSRVVSKDKKIISSTSQSKRKKKDYDMFDESNIIIDMSNENIKPKKIKITSTLLLECRTVVVDEPDKKKFSYPGIVFIRKMKDDKCFEFNIPLAIASRVVNAIEIMMNDKNNPKTKE